MYYSPHVLCHTLTTVCLACGRGVVCACARRLKSPRGTWSIPPTHTQLPLYPPLSRRPRGTFSFEGMLLPMFVHTLLTTTGSGIVGPVLLRDPPLFLENDLLVTCIIAFFFFAVVFDPYVVNFARIVSFCPF